MNTRHPNPNKPHLWIHQLRLPDGTQRPVLRITNTGPCYITRAQVREIMRLEQAWGWNR